MAITPWWWWGGREFSLSLSLFLFFSFSSELMHPKAETLKKKGIKKKKWKKEICVYLFHESKKGGTETGTFDRVSSCHNPPPAFQPARITDVPIGTHSMVWSVLELNPWPSHMAPLSCRGAPLPAPPLLDTERESL